MNQFQKEVLYTIQQIINVLFTDTEHNYNVNNGTVTSAKIMPTVTIPPTTAVAENTKYKDKNNDIAVIPTGFRVSSDSTEQTIKTGLVVYDGNDNEWVWIPVWDASIMYTKSDDGIAITGGKGKTYVSEVSTDYYSNTILNGKTRGIPNTTSFREPDIVVNSTLFDALASNYTAAGFVSLKDMSQKLISDYADMVKSIIENYGFYVGRYELTGTIAEPTEKKGWPLANKNWYNLYKACKNINTGTIGVVESRMIWGCQWDVMCNFIKDYGDRKNIDNSSTWGNYYQTQVYSSDRTSTLSERTAQKRLQTGITTFTVANKIYDIAGNYSEFTQEACDNSNRVCRGGYSNKKGTEYPASNRDTITADSNYDYLTTRPVLYVK